MLQKGLHVFFEFDFFKKSLSWDDVYFLLHFMKFENLTPYTFNPKLEAITQDEFLPIITPHIELHSRHIYETAYASIGLPYDDTFIQESTNLAKKFQNSQAMLLIGIGGSNLWTLAIHEALGGNLENKKQLFPLDTPDVRDYKKVHKELTNILEKWEQICITVISKSGTTTETIALFETAYNDFYKKYPLQCGIVAITDEWSKLYHLGQNEWWDILTLPKNVGGRYSVFSNVGLFPLAFLDYNIQELLTWARSVLRDFIQEPLASPAYKNASVLYTGYTEERRNICEHFFFGKSYENIGKWYRQLLAESIGKKSEWSESIGITPTTSIGTIDLHSVGQLDLAHGKDRTLVLVFPENGSPLYTPKEWSFPFLVENIRGISFEHIQYAAFEGTRRALLEKHIPTMTYTLQDDSIEDIGAFLQTKMIEVILLGHFFSVNPFDQPNVEDYKTGMRDVLAKWML